MLRLNRIIAINCAILFILLFTACNVQAPSPTPSSVPIPTLSPAPAPAPELESRNTAFIRDSAGRIWDVTHARDVYDMNPNYFNYGLGIGVISSVDNPKVFDEGDSGYPDPDSRTSVFGVTHNGEQRAYSVSALERHEVFNDIYPGESNQYLAVTY